MATCKALWCLSLLADKHQGTTLTAPLGALLFPRHPYWHLSAMNSDLFLSWDLPEWTSFVPQATNCRPAVQLQSSTTWQLIPECNTDVSPSRDHCCYCSPPDWEALPAFGIVCQINLANILQINWCRAPGVRTDIDAEGNLHPESQWQKENVARVSMTGEHSLRRKRWKKVEGGEASREKERENTNDFMGKPWEAEQNLPHQRGESWCRQPDHRYTWRSKAWQCYLVFAC